MFICNHCPFVHHVMDEIILVANDYRVQGIGIVAISSNDITIQPLDSPELMTEFAFDNKFEFPYLYDETQEIAKAYDAACTPDFVFIRFVRQIGLSRSIGRFQTRKRNSVKRERFKRCHRQFVV